MEYLRNILLRNPDAESIDLEFQEISSIDQLAPLLGQMNKLKELLLHGNRLQHLPENLTLLYQLETLDISNNMITNIQNVLPGLASLPKLKDLTINIKSQKDESLLKQHLPQLEYLNGKPFKSIVIKKSEEITLKQKDLETVAILYDNIRELFQEVDPSLDENLANQFDMHIKTVMFDLSSKLKPNLPEYEVNSQIAEAKFSLYSICFKQFEEYLKSLHPKISSVMSGLHDSYDNIYADMASKFTYIHYII